VILTYYNNNVTSTSFMGNALKTPFAIICGINYYSKGSLSKGCRKPIESS